MAQKNSRFAAQQLNQASALQASCYFGEASLRRDLAAVLQSGWQLLAGVDQLAQAGGQLHLELADLPIWLIADAPDANSGAYGTIRVLHDVCRHRAGPLELVGNAGRHKLRCRYHGWSYGLDGCLLKATEMESATGFDPATICLPQAEVAVWQGLVFAALTPTKPFAEVIADIDDRVDPVGLGDFVFHSQIAYDVDCNWKTYIDNFLEGYHIPHIHPELNRMLDYRNYELELGQWWSLQHSALDSDIVVYGEGEALYYFIYPNTMLNIVPDRMQTNRVLPLAAERCRVVFDFFYRPDDEAAIAAKAAEDHQFSDLVQQQDIEICQAVQQRLASGSYQAGRLNPKRESGVWHFHELLRAEYRQADGG